MMIEVISKMSVLAGVHTSVCGTLHVIRTAFLCTSHVIAVQCDLNHTFWTLFFFFFCSAPESHHMQCDSSNRTQFCALFQGVVNLILTPAADHMDAVRLLCSAMRGGNTANLVRFPHRNRVNQG